MAHKFETDTVLRLRRIFARAILIMLKFMPERKNAPMIFHGGVFSFQGRELKNTCPASLSLTLFYMISGL